ncbi:MAG: hypothetical protein ACRDY1_00130, partial [Acidimicrobiales bacterium]
RPPPPEPSRSFAMTRTAKRQWATALAAALVAAVAALTLGAPAPSRTGAVARTVTPAVARPVATARPTVRPLTATSVAAELSALSHVGVARTAQTVAALTSAPGMPACAPPAMPAPTYPPGNTYGVPFLAAITGGQVLAGYDEWIANHLTWHAQGTTYDLDPWDSKIYDITGWVTGLLQLPSLSATIAPQDIVFCDNGGGESCVAADAPAGQCIHIISQYGPSQGSPVPPPALGNDHPAGTACTGYSTPTFACVPFVISLTPAGNTTVTVLGVESNGGLDLQVTTAASATVNEYTSSGPPVATCTDDPVSVTLSTVAPTGLPATAPPAPDPPNTDERGPQVAPQPLSGPLASGTSTVVSNNFAIPAFVPSPGGAPCTPPVAELLNTYAGGFDASFKDQTEGLYYLDGGTDPIAAQPGWGQFSATTTVVGLGLPVGPPAGFNF